MIPTRLLVALAFVPVILGFAAVFVPAAIAPMIALDALLVAVAALDAFAASGAVVAEREVKPIQAVGRAFGVRVAVRHAPGHARELRLRVTDDAPGEASGIPFEGVLTANAVVRGEYTCRVDTRGRHAFGAIAVRWRSRLGLWERQQRVAVATEIRVYPDFAQLRTLGLDARLAEQRVPVRVRRRAGGENEFERLRPYVPGDPYKHIDWKATARKREFVTREFGQEVNQNILFLLDAGRMTSARSGGWVAFDRALDATVAMGQAALRHGDRVGLLAFDKDVRVWLPPRGGTRAGARMIRALYDIFPSEEEPDYATAFRYLAQRVRRRSLVVLITAVTDEVSAANATALVGALARRHLAVTVWLRDADVDGLLVDAPATEEARWQRAAAAELTAWRERSLASLRRRGAVVVDCPGDQLAPQLLARYLEIKARRLL